jgi:hypothetical protein
MMALFAIVNPEQQPNAPEVPVAISAKFLNLDCLRLGVFAAGFNGYAIHCVGLC